MKNINKIFLVLVILVPSIVIGQEIKQPNHEKKSFIDSTGRYYQQADLPVYLFVANSANGNAKPLQATIDKEVVLEGDGIHAFKHENLVTKRFDEFLIYADGVSPISKISFSKSKGHIKDGKTFYQKGLSLTIASTDNMSGVEETYYSLNYEPFKKYSPLKFDEEGDFTYVYYSVDRTGNTEKLKTQAFTIDNTAPETFHNFINISSQSIISTNSSIYLTIKDELSGAYKTFYKFDKEEFRAYTKGNIDFKYLSDGQHTLHYYSVDNVDNVEDEKEFSFYLDKTAPIMSADVLGDKFIVGERVYFSGRTKLKLTAIDNKSGIKEVTYSINDGTYVNYEEPFYLPNRSGIHNVKFKAVDNENNAVSDNFEHSVGVIYVDLTGPTLASSFQGSTFNKADTIFVSPQTTISLKGNDPESGLRKITYSLDGSATESDYEEPISLNDKGFHQLDYFGYDNVSNRNAKSIYFVTDTQGPEISSQFATPASADGKYPSYTTIYLAAVDSEVGARQISYKINGGKERIYAAPLTGFKKNKKYSVAVKATDMLGNTSDYTLEFETGKY